MPVAALDVGGACPLQHFRRCRSAKSHTLSLGFFALIALVLAAVGVYGVLAYSVSQRTREFGIRMAVGAPQQTLVLLVLKQGLRVVVIGLALGGAAAVLVSRLMEGLIFGVGATDPLSFVGAVVVLSAVALLAGISPPAARRGSIPWEALRHE